jgi:hypothetical protein
VLCACAQVALAQDAREFGLAAQSLVYQRDGVVQGCGVRLTGGEPNASAPSSWLDVSFNVFRRGVALAQAIAYEIGRSEYAGDSRPSSVPIQSTWLKPAEGKARLGENSERRESLVYPLGLDDALALFQAVAQNEPVIIGVKRWGQRTDSVYTGKAVLDSDTRARIGECLTSLLE